MGEGESRPGPGVVLSGATGFLGGEILARLLARAERPVYVLVRAGDAAAARARLRATLIELIGSAEHLGRWAVAVPADLTRATLGLERRQLEWLAERAEWIVHCAASVSFTLPLRESREINVAGTRRMLELAALARERGPLQCFSHVSTAYVAGTHDATFAEADLDVGQGYRNPYERTKFEAELAVTRARELGMPAQILRPSIVVGDSRTGWTPAFNVLYWPLRAFARGSYRVLPARRGSPVDVVPVDYVADAVLALGGRPGTTYHLTASDRASSVGELVDMACQHLDRDRPRLIPPALYRRTIHPLLVRTGSEARRRALRRSEPFFPYFAMRTRYDNTDARAALAPREIQVPNLRSYFDRLIGYALRAEWGRAGVARHRLLPRGPVVPRRAEREHADGRSRGSRPAPADRRLQRR